MSEKLLAKKANLIKSLADLDKKIEKLEHQRKGYQIALAETLEKLGEKEDV